MVRVAVLTGHGINCEEETAFAFQRVGCRADIVHVEDLIRNKSLLSQYQILAFPGGFSYGDHTGSGKLYANDLRDHLADQLREFVERDTLTIGICNGFQIMTLLGLAPALDNKYSEPQVALMMNTRPRYHTRWVELLSGSDKCVFTRGIKSIELPVAHGEGQFYAPPEVLMRLQQSGQVALRYSVNGVRANGKLPHNPNGSLDDIAGICDSTGRVFGLMPHPERAIDQLHHPDWPRQHELLKRQGKDLPSEGAGMRVFRNAAEYFA